MNVLNLPPLSQFGVNSYLIWDENMNGALIDAPYGGDYILKQIAEKGVKLKRSSSPTATATTLPQRHMCPTKQVRK